MSRSLFSLCLSLALMVLYSGGPTALGAASDIKTADGLFEKHQYQPALEIYEKVAKATKGEAQWQAQYRAAECEALLFRYLEAANRMLDAGTPTDNLWKARFLILRAELGREYLNQYGWQLTQEAESGTGDRARRTAPEWHKEIRAHYRELVRLEKFLTARSLTSEAYYVQVEKTDRVAYPSLWDFAVHRAVTYLLTEHPAPPFLERPSPERFLEESYGTDAGDSLSPGEEAGRLAERAASGSSSPAKELWRIFRLQIPFRFSGQVGRWKDAKAGRAMAVDRLKRWAEAFQSDRSRADALSDAAALLEQNEEFAAAVTICKEVERAYGKTEGARDCSRLRSQIELPQLSLKFFPTQPGAKDTLEVTVRNLDRLFLRLYPADTAMLKKLRDREGDSLEYLSNLPRKAYESLLGQTPKSTAEFPIRYGSPHGRLTTKLTAPNVAPGLYVAVLSGDKHFESTRSVLSAGVLNVTELFLFGSAGAPATVPKSARNKDFPAFHLYAVDGNTGLPADNANFETFLQMGWGNVKAGSYQADKNGKAQVLSHFTQDYQYQSLQALARRGDHHAFFSQPLTLQHAVPERFSVQLDTDRPIYRPGQSVLFKVSVLENLVPGWRVYKGKETVRLTIADPNGQSFHTATLKAGPYGSASAKFVIPTGRLLGSYSIRAEIKDNGKNYVGYHVFEVEEYKRPEFEVKISDARGPWRYGTTATVEGNASYYFGGGVPKATVTYRVTRETFVPWFCWWWRWRQPTPPQEVTSGTMTTDEAGKFKFTLTPVADAEDEPGSVLPAGYAVEIEARDAGGRTIKATRRFQAGATAALLAVETPDGFLKPNAVNTLSAGLRSLNDTMVAGQGTFRVLNLTLPSPFPALDPEIKVWQGRPSQQSLDQLLAKIPDGAEAATGEFRSVEGALGTLQIPALKVGVYRLRLEAKDPTGADLKLALILTVAGDKATPAAPQVTLAEHPKYVVGETARILLGSTELAGKLFVEVWRGQDLFRTEILPGGTHVLAVPVTEALKGGFTVRWFGVHRFRFWSGETAVAVPWRDKELALRLNAPKSIKPGEKVAWGLTAETADKKPIDGEGTLRVYDRSLEYYAGGAGSWASGLYPPNAVPSPEGDSYFAQWTQALSAETAWLEKQLGILQSLYDGITTPPPPTLRAFHSRLHGRNYGRRAMRAKGMADAEGGMELQAMSDSAAPPAQAMGGASGGAALAKKSEKSRDDSSPEPVPVRSDFSETAVFEPHLAFKNGKATLAFRSPERLTSWKVTGYVLTEDAKTGSLSSEFATRKEIMVRIESPRFFREGDKSVLKALIHNETEQGFSADVQLSILRGDSDAAAAFGLASAKRTLKIAPGAVGVLSWPITAPKDFSRHKIRVTARSGKLVDGEEREIQVLPARVRLVESRVAYLEGATQETFQIPSHIKANEFESGTLQIDPQLALLLLNGLPQLVLYPFDCTEQLVNRMVPLTLVQRMFEKYPDLKEATKKIPSRKTVLPTWDLADPRRLTEMAESPWALTAKGSQPDYPTADLTRPEVVQSIRGATQRKLESYQLPGGGFPWFPGGKADLYLTLYVLQGYEELMRFGIDIPEDLVRKAYAYVLTELKRHYQNDVGAITLGLYGAFVLSAYFEKYPWAAEGKQLMQSWLGHAEKHSRAMTAMGLAYASWIHHRLGNAKRAADYLERALSGSRKDKLMGVYWQPEKLSWLWYNDTEEKHAFLLRTLQALKPKDPRLPGLVQWLLFHRKGNEWKSTRSSAAALYALMDYFQAKGALKGADTFQWAWGTRKETVTVKGSDWLSQPLRWTVTGDAPVAQPLSLSKKGPGIAIASFTTIFSTDSPDAHSNTADNLMSLERRVFKRVRSGSDFRLDRLKPGDKVAVGDLIEIQFVVNSRSQFEYLHLRAPRPAGMEPETLTSGWKWESLARYEEIRDSMENFFISWMPQGEYVLKYRLRATTPGEYRFGATLLQSMYAPEFSAYTGSFAITVTEP